MVSGARDLAKKWVSGVLQGGGRGDRSGQNSALGTSSQIPGHCPNGLGFPGWRAEGRMGWFLLCILSPCPL